MTESLDDLLTYEEAAREIGIALGSVKQAVNRGLLHPIKIPRERHKFLRREDVLRYRDGKKAYTHAQQATPRGAASQPPHLSRVSLPNAEPYQEILEASRLLVLVEDIRISLLASIREALIGLAEANYATSSSLTASPPLRAYQAAGQKTELPFGTGPRNSFSEQVSSIAHLLSEMLARRVVQTDTDEQAIQQLRELLILYTQSKVPSSPSSAQPPQRVCDTLRQQER